MELDGSALTVTPAVTLTFDLLMHKKQTHMCNTCLTTANIHQQVCVAQNNVLLLMKM